MESRAEVDRLAAEAPQAEPCVGAVVVGFEAEHERRSEAVRQGGRGCDKRRPAPGLPDDAAALRGIDEVDCAVDPPIRRNDVDDGANVAANWFACCPASPIAFHSGWTVAVIWIGPLGRAVEKHGSGARRNRPRKLTPWKSGRSGDPPHVLAEHARPELEPRANPSRCSRK